MGLTRKQLAQMEADGVAKRKRERAAKAAAQKRLFAQAQKAQAFVNKAWLRQITYKPWPSHWYKLPDRRPFPAGAAPAGFSQLTLQRTLHLYQSLAECLDSLYAMGVRVRCWTPDSDLQSKLNLSHIAPAWGSVVVTRTIPTPSALAASVYYQRLAPTEPAMPHVYAAELRPTTRRYVYQLTERSLEQFATSGSTASPDHTWSTLLMFRVPRRDKYGLLDWGRYDVHPTPALGFVPATTKAERDWALPLVHAVQSWAMDISIPGPMM